MMAYLKRPSRQKFQAGGRVGYDIGDIVKPQISYSKTGKNPIKDTPLTIDSEFLDMLIEIELPILEKLDLLADFQKNKSRHQIDIKDQEVFVDEGGSRARKIGLGWNEGGEGLSGSVKHNVDTGQTEGMLKISKTFDDGGREGLKRGTNLATGERYRFPTGADNPGVPIQHQEVNIQQQKVKLDKKLRAKELLEKGLSRAQATKQIVKEFKLTRHPYAGSAPWMTDAASEVIEAGGKITPGTEGTGGKKRATRKRDFAIGKEPTRFESRIKKLKTKSRLGKIYETAHTANIFQAKKLGADYPIDALQLQLKKVNQEVAEVLNDELKPLYKKQRDLLKKAKVKNTPELVKALDNINFKISEMVSSGGSQGKKAANVLRGWHVDPKTLKPYLPELGFNTLQSVDRGITGATTKAAKVGTEADAIARANYLELLKEKSKKAGKYGKYALAAGKGLGKLGLRTVGAAIPFVGPAMVGWGVADVAKAHEMGLTNEELAVAYGAGPEIAQMWSDLKDQWGQEEIVTENKPTYGPYADQIKKLVS